MVGKYSMNDLAGLTSFETIASISLLPMMEKCSLKASAILALSVIC